MRYAIIHDGAPVEIFPNQGFEVWLLVETPPAEEDGEPGSELQSFNAPANWRDFFTEVEFEQFGVQLVTPATAPAGQRLASRDLLIGFDGGRPVIVEPAIFEPIPPAPLEPAQAQALAMLDAAREARISTDFDYDFGATVAIDDQGGEEPAGVRALQMGVNNRRDWQALQGLALTVGGGATLLPIRCSDNVNVQTTAAQVLQVLAAATVRGSAIVFYAAARKALVRQATTAAQVDQVVADSTEWPA